MYKKISEASDLIGMDVRTFRIQDSAGEIFNVIGTEPVFNRIGAKLRSKDGTQFVLSAQEFRLRGFEVIPPLEMEYDDFEESP